MLHMCTYKAGMQIYGVRLYETWCSILLSLGPSASATYACSSEHRWSAFARSRARPFKKRWRPNVRTRVRRVSASIFGCDPRVAVGVSARASECDLLFSRRPPEHTNIDWMGVGNSRSTSSSSPPPPQFVACVDRGQFEAVVH
jgi:hypothetical protein